MSREFNQLEAVGDSTAGHRLGGTRSLQPRPTKRYYLETLGCPKNTVDAQGIARLLAEAGYTGTPNSAEADVLIVNTCGFIEAARAESLATLRELAAHKRPDQLLIAAGCLAQRSGQTLADSVPAVDGILGTRRWMDILHLLEQVRRAASHPIVMCGARTPVDSPLACTQRVAIEGPSAYLKVADGCSASCAFCAIPGIKGEAHSRPWPDVVADAEQLVRQGVQEIILIAQDTAAYGWDRGQRDGLAGLIERILQRVPQLPWLRILYAYPQHIRPSLIDVMVSHPQVCHYLDLPLQHAHPDVLRRMRRPANTGSVHRLIERLRSGMHDIALRTSFIVGFPGETEGEFQALLDFAAEIEFDKVGVFTYSQEEGTAAAELPGQLPQGLKKERYRRLMELQQGISLARNQAMVGRTLDMLVEGYSEGVSSGRSYRDAPEIDGLVLVEGRLPIAAMVPVRITEALHYDLIGRVEANTTITHRR
jgi:ribosomal protein S12 methylthiotransferase